MFNKLRFHNRSSMEQNKSKFFEAMEKDFLIPSAEIEKGELTSGYLFLFDSETGGHIKAEFFYYSEVKDGVAIPVTDISGDNAEEVILVYNSFVGMFADEPTLF